jgi:hypothetical protein
MSEGVSMTRSSAAAALASATFLLTLVTEPAFAQDTRSACTRDVTRMCRSVINDGDMAVLACLKQHRSRLSRGCQRVLSENNQ